MTVIFSKKCEIGLQAVLFLSAQTPNQRFSAAEVAKKINAPKEFTSKILQDLTGSKIVASKKGKFGGFYLGRNPKDIKLIDIVIAIDGLEIFHKCVLGFKGCSVEVPCPCHDKWGSLRDETYKMLSSETLEELRDSVIRKIDSL
ncbi:MAG: transcriptional regulator, BadM/Rrf2 family [Ignavibacteria bacterium]|nr:transcriptional regulator, BadM/Rrf2 family [Ignavibacteria bacterium]